MPGKNNYSPIGLDMGVTSVKMAQLQKNGQGWAVRDMIVKEIRVSDHEDREKRKESIIQTIRDCMKESSFLGKSVVSVMPGYKVDILPIKISLVEDESMEEAILREASLYLSYDVENAVIDYLPVENNESLSEKSADGQALLMAVRREDVDEHLSILKEAKLKPQALDISACALARTIGFSLADKDSNALIINAGELHTTLTVLQKGGVLFDRNILWGRDNMVESLMNRLKLDREKAGELLNRVGLHPKQKEGQGQENERDVQANKIAEAVYEIVAAQLEKLGKEIEKVFQYFSSEKRGAVIDAIYLMGGASTIKDLDIYLTKRTGIPAEGFNPFSVLNTPAKGRAKDNTNDGPYFGVALGLALRQIMSNGKQEGK